MNLFYVRENPKKPTIMMNYIEKKNVKFLTSRFCVTGEITLVEKEELKSNSKRLQELIKQHPINCTRHSPLCLLLLLDIT